MFENLTEARRETEPKLFRAIHREAVQAVEELKSKEIKLIQALQEVDENFVYRYLGFNSLFRYCVEALKLTEAQSMMYITVSRKSKKLPCLQKALESGEVTVSKVNRVVSVINNENEQYWLDLTKTLSKREIEKEVAKINPRAVTPEKTRYLNDTTIELQIPVSEEVFNLLKRAQEILVQKAQRPVSLEEVIRITSQSYLEKADPIKREVRRQRKIQAKGVADKNQSDASVGLRDNSAASANNSALCPGRATKSDEGSRPHIVAPPLPKYLKQKTKDRILARDGGRCTYRQGNRQCSERVYLQVHHIYPRELGGTNEPSNLTTLCSGHHRVLHEEYH